MQKVQFNSKRDEDHLITVYAKEISESVGMLAGAVLVVDGFNGLSKELRNLTQSTGHSFSQGIFADYSVYGFQFENRTGFL